MNFRSKIKMLDIHLYVHRHPRSPGYT